MKNYWKDFGYKTEKFTERQKEYVNHIRFLDYDTYDKQKERLPVIKKTDPNCYVKISPEEIERQYKQAMEQMKRDQEAIKAHETSIEVEGSLSHGR